ncbi:MAG: G5 domain-containing protein [Acidimicrobiia bacterium]
MITVHGRARPITDHSSRPASRGHRAWLHARRHTAPLPAHVTRAIRPSPARAHAHDPSTWLPVPDVSSLPTIDVMLEVTAEPAIDLVALEALVTPTPARAEPHDAATWLPLPGDLHTMPELTEMLAPNAALQAAVLAETDALVADAAAAAEAAVAPSPARAEPHDATTWLPLPDPESLVPLTELAAAADDGASRPRGWRRVSSATFRPRNLLLLLLVTATAVAVVRPMVDTKSVAVAGLAPIAVNVDLDGTQHVVTTTARHAPALMRQLHVGKLVAVRTAPGTLQNGSSVVFRTRRSGLLSVDGQTLSFDSPSRTVGELIAAFHVSLDGEDTTSPSPDTLLADGDRVTVVRVGAATTQTTEAIPFTEESVVDPTVAIGETRQIRAGKDGTATVTWRERVENGVVVGRTMLSKVTTVAPVSNVVGTGSKADWHWDKLAECESGGKWNTVDQGTPAYDGGLGIYRGTWRAYGGTEFAPNAGLATREQQIIVGMRIHADLGWDPWGCANHALGWN